MGLQHLLAVLLFMTLFQYSTSTPILERRKVDPDGWVDYYNDEFQGIYWQEAWDTCTEREFKLIADTAEMVSRRFMSPDVNNGQPDRETAGWTRFFAGKAVSYPWTDPELGSPKAYKNILYALNQVRNWPVKGKTNRKKNVSRATRIVFTCREPSRNSGHCDASQVGAYTVPQEKGNPEDANMVVFCRPFLDDYNAKSKNSRTKQTLTDRTYKVTSRDMSEMETLLTKEHIMLHEYFHCNQVLNVPVFIEDLKNVTLPDGEYIPMVYGAEKCAKLAWTNIKFAQTRDLTRINPNASINADNYAWMFTFNWFKKEWGWTSDGAYHWDDNSKRDLSDSGDDDDAFNVDGNDTLTGTTGMSLEQFNQSASLPNCQQVGDEPDDVQCAYVGDDSIEEWASEHPDFTLTSTLMTVPTITASIRTPFTTHSTTSAPSVSCYAYQNPGVASGCQCDGSAGIYAQMSSSSGQKSYNPCGWTTAPPLASTTASTANVTAADGTISYCTSAVPEDADVNNALSCAVTATPVGVNSTIASEYSVYSSSTAAAAAAAQSTASEAHKVSGDIAIALQVFVREGGIEEEFDYWAVRNFDNRDGDFCSGPADVYKDSEIGKKVQRGNSMGDIVTDSVPYPPSFNFTSDLIRGEADYDTAVSSLDGWPCYYEGSSDAPGTVSCTGWKNITCTDDLKDANNKVDCGHYINTFNGEMTYYPKVLCTFDQSDMLSRLP